MTARLPSAVYATREWLRRPLGLQHRIAALEDSLAELRGQAGALPSPRWNGLPGGGTPGDPTAQTAGRLAAAAPLRQKLNALRQQREQLCGALIDWLDAADLTPRQYTLLLLHYIEALPWLDVAARMHLCERYVYRLHREALDRLAACPRPPALCGERYTR